MIRVRRARGFHNLLPSGDGVVIASGGSSHGLHRCLQPWDHLDQSSAATASWLESIGIDPSAAVVLNFADASHERIDALVAQSLLAGHAHLLPSRFLKDPATLLSVSEAWPTGASAHIWSRWFRRNWLGCCVIQWGCVGCKP